MANATIKTVKQCKSCPWRVNCDPTKDIPNGYSSDMHKDLAGTINSGMASISDTLKIMACHYSPVGKEFPCAGWLNNQLGDGNNIGARIAVARNELPMPEIDGMQHQRFEDTIPST